MQEVISISTSKRQELIDMLENSDYVNSSLVYGVSNRNFRHAQKPTTKFSVWSVFDITKEVSSIAKKSGIKNGICHIFIMHSTAAIIINENYDPNICLDLLDALNGLVPQGKWRHDRIDGNADAHIKASILGHSDTIANFKNTPYWETMSNDLISKGFERPLPLRFGKTYDELNQVVNDFVKEMDK
ncbi:MAG: secondary thiamine-phosphate synthase enzyme YjbQ [Nanoarchaeota archaeon]